MEGRHEGTGQDRLGDVGAIEAVDAVDPEHPALLLATARAARAACKEVMLLERVLRTQRPCIRLAPPLSPRAAHAHHHRDRRAHAHELQNDNSRA